MRIDIVKVVVGLLSLPIALTLSVPSQGFVTGSAAQWVVGQTVNTTSGPVDGHAASNNTEVSEYLGIPFAEPPVDDLRWQRPVAYNDTAPINGTAFVSRNQYKDAVDPSLMLTYLRDMPVCKHTLLSRQNAL